MSGPGQANLNPRGGDASILAMPDPDYREALYWTSNAEYCGHWHDGTRGTSTSEDVPKISDILAARPTIRKPVRPLQTTAKCILANQIEAARKERDADKVLTADILPKKYPVRAEAFCYPEDVKKGADNPLYNTTSKAHGSEMPMPHQITDRYFPSGNQFTKGFVDTRPRFTGLNTTPILSKVHAALDAYY